MRADQNANTIYQFQLPDTYVLSQPQGPEWLLQISGHQHKPQKYPIFLFHSEYNTSISCSSQDCSASQAVNHCPLICLPLHWGYYYCMPIPASECLLVVPQRKIIKSDSCALRVGLGKHFCFIYPIRKINTHLLKILSSFRKLESTHFNILLYRTQQLVLSLFSVSLQFL